MQSHTTGPTDVALLEETIGENLRATAAAHPDREALVVVDQGIRYDYRTFDGLVDRLAAGLIDRGLEVGDRLGIWSPNNHEWVLVQYATARAGIVLVNINPAYRTSELRYALAQSGCRAVVTAADHRGSSYVAMIDEVRAETPDLQQVIVLGSPEWDDLLAERDLTAVAVREAELDPGQAINIQYTSGTTGFPKGATLSHRNILNNAFFVGERCGYSDADRVCIPVPFYHCFGMVLGNLACTTHGATIVVPSKDFDAAAALQAVESERCTSLYGVPTMFIAELNDPDFGAYDLSSLRTGIMAGSPCPVEVMKRVINDMHMEAVTIAYGLTEVSPVATQTLPTDDIERRVSTVGTAHPHVSVRITDPETGDVAERGTASEVCMSGYSVMLGYWNDPERTAEAIDADGWLHSGDLGVMDADGYVNIVGRIKDMIIRGGENIYPREIEEFLFTHPEIVDAQVVGVPDERFGEEVMAWIQRVPGSTLDAEAVTAYCKGRIAHFKVPRHIAFVDEYPMTITGKIQKFKLREMGIERLERQAAAEIETA